MVFGVQGKAHVSHAGRWHDRMLGQRLHIKRGGLAGWRAGRRALGAVHAVLIFWSSGCLFSPSFPSFFSLSSVLIYPSIHLFACLHVRLFACRFSGLTCHVMS
ncbi:hypothetical protein BC567DRAFT_231559 [Phyllosticta citribraziliensis]